MEQEHYINIFMHQDKIPKTVMPFVVIDPYVRYLHTTMAPMKCSGNMLHKKASPVQSMAPPCSLSDET